MGLFLKVKTKFYLNIGLLIFILTTCSDNQQSTRSSNQQIISSEINCLLSIDYNKLKIIDSESKMVALGKLIERDGKILFALDANLKHSTGTIYLSSPFQNKAEENKYIGKKIVVFYSNPYSNSNIIGYVIYSDENKKTIDDFYKIKL